VPSFLCSEGLGAWVAYATIAGRMRATFIHGQIFVRLTRVFVEGELQSGSVVELPRETGAHLAKVCARAAATKLSSSMATGVIHRRHREGARLAASAPRSVLRAA